MARHEQEALWAFASEELGAEERARVAEHLAGCEDCTRKLAEVRQAQALLRTAREEEPAVRWSEVDERIQNAAARRLAGLERRPRWPWALAPAALAAVLAFVLLRPVASPPPPDTAVAAREEPPTAETPAPREEKETPPAPTPVMATRVESASGAWLREPNAPERSLQAGTQLRAGASVRTRAKSSALLQLPDASRVRVSPDSEVTLARTEAKEVHLHVTRGRLTVQASHVARQGFTVEAAGVRASVVGTVFSVECTEKGAVVSVLEGKVRIEAEGQPLRFVSAGERLAMVAGQQAPKIRALSAQDRQAFAELGVMPREAPSTPRPSPEERPTAPESGAAVAQVPPVEEPAGAQAPARPEAPADAAASGSEPEEAVVKAPSPPGGGTRPELGSSSLWSPPRPGVDLPGTTDARFLWHAREQLDARTCESFLVGLAEIAERSTVAELREQARYLRARCFELHLASAEAAAEYRRYLREFPKGRYVREAKAALLP